MFSFQKKKTFLSEQENNAITESIKKAEKRTSGEVRVYIESRCKFVEPLDRAAELFFGLKMDQTRERNAVLVYIAVKDKQLAIFGDQGIHEKTGDAFWKKQVEQMISEFNKQNYAAGIVKVVSEVGE